MAGRILTYVIVAAVAILALECYGREREQNALLRQRIQGIRMGAQLLQDQLDRRDVADRERQAELARLEADTAQLRAAYRTERARARAADRRLQELRATVDADTLPAPVRELVEAERDATEAAQAEADACSVLLTNCERRVGLLEAGIAARDSSLIEAYAWRQRALRLIDELERAIDGPVSLGLTLGYGATYADGRFHNGPSATAGVTIALELPDLWPFW